MSKVLHAGLIPGTATQVVSIYEGGDDLPLANPSYYIDRLYFDSRLDYLNIVNQTDASVSFIVQDVTQNCGKKGKDCSLIPRSGTNTFTLCAHGQSYTPAVLMYDIDTGRSLTGNMFIQSVSNTSFRMCWVLVDGGYVYLKERWFVRSNALPSITKNFRIFVFNKPSV